jgi:hypothetical protein
MIASGQGTWMDILPENTTHGEQNMKSCSTSLIFREIQRKITLKHHLTPVGFPTIKKEER